MTHAIVSPQIPSLCTVVRSSDDADDTVVRSSDEDADDTVVRSSNDVVVAVAVEVETVVGLTSSFIHCKT